MDRAKCGIGASCLGPSRTEAPKLIERRNYHFCHQATKISRRFGEHGRIARRHDNEFKFRDNRHVLPCVAAGKVRVEAGVLRNPPEIAVRHAFGQAAAAMWRRRFVDEFRVEDLPAFQAAAPKVQLAEPHGIARPQLEVSICDWVSVGVAGPAVVLDTEWQDNRSVANRTSDVPVARASNAPRTCAAPLL